MEAHIRNFLSCMRTAPEADAGRRDRRAGAGADFDGSAVVPGRPRPVLRREDLEGFAESLQGVAQGKLRQDGYLTGKVRIGLRNRR